MKKISGEDFNSAPQKWQETALDEPVVIAEKGVPKLYLLSREVFDSLYRGSRDAVAIADLDERAKKMLLEAEVSPEHDHLNALLEDEEG